MHRKREAVLPFECNNDHLPKTVREVREKYKQTRWLSNENPEILDRVHKDIENPAKLRPVADASAPSAAPPPRSGELPMLLANRCPTTA